MVRAVVAFAHFELELFFKTLIAVFFTYLMPCAIYGGILASYKGDPAVAAGHLLPLFTGLMMVFISLYTLASQVVINREGGFYKRLLVTNLDPVGVAVSTAIRGYVLAMLGLLILVIETRIGFGTFPQFNVFEGCAAIAIAGAALFLLAMIPACFIKRSSSMFAVASVLSYALVFFSGIRPPLGAADRFINLVDLVSPSYYAVHVMQAGFAGMLFRADVAWSVLALVIFMALSVVIVRRYFTWT